MIGVVMMVMYTWRRGSRLLFDKTRKTEVPLDALVGSLERKPPHRVPAGRHTQKAKGCLPRGRENNPFRFMGDSNI